MDEAALFAEAGAYAADFADFAARRSAAADDGALDETVAVADRDMTLVPKGHLPCGAPCGVEKMAGPPAPGAFKTTGASTALTAATPDARSRPEGQSRGAPEPRRDVFVWVLRFWAATKRVDRTRSGMASTLGAYDRAACGIAARILQTVAQPNGRRVERHIKNKNTDMTQIDLSDHVAEPRGTGWALRPDGAENAFSKPARLC